jgi:hypothetical protein
LNNYYYIAIAAFLLYLIFRKKEDSVEAAIANSNTIIEEHMKAEIYNGLSAVLERYGADFAKNVERLYRLESAHFKSQQFKKGFSAGMEAFGAEFPYGWTSLKEFINKEAPDLKPSDFSTFEMREGGTGKIKTFIKFPSVYYAMMFLAFVIEKRNSNFGSWYSKKPEAQQRYNEKLKTIRPRIVNELLA